MQQTAAQTAVTDAVLVGLTSRSKAPVFDKRALKPGAAVVAMGASLPNGRQLHDHPLSRCSHMVLEWLP